MRTTIILNLKGGVAKTASTVNIAAILAKDYQKRVLLVDADSQCNTTEFFGGDPANGNLAEVLRYVGIEDDGAEFAVASIQPTTFEGIDLLAGDDSLMDLDLTKVELRDVRAIRGVDQFTIKSGDPFLVQVNHGGSDDRVASADKPLSTMTAKLGVGVVDPIISPVTVTNTSNSVGSPADEPINTVRTGGGGGQMLIAPTLIAIGQTGIIRVTSTGKTSRWPAAAMRFVRRWPRCWCGRICRSGVNNPPLRRWRSLRGRWRWGEGDL